MRTLRRAGTRLGMSLMLACAMVLTLVPVMAPAATVAKTTPSTVPSVLPDQYEVDNIQSQAKWIQVGAAPQQRTVHAVGNVDWVKFQAKAGGTYVIDTLNGELFSKTDAVGKDGKAPGGLSRSMLIGLEIYDAAGNLLMGNPLLYMVGGASVQALSPNAGVDPWGRLVYTSTKDQTLFVRCKAEPFYYYLLGTGAYTLQVRGAKAAISGNVKDPEGDPVEFALVWAEAYRGAPTAQRTPQIGGVGVGYTDVQGNYTIADIEPGQYLVEFESQQNDELRDEFYDNADNPVDAKPVEVGSLGVTRNINAVLDYATPVISGTVVNEDGDPIEGVQVALYYGYNPSSWYGPSDYAYTDESGHYQFTHVPWGYDGYRLQFYDQASGGNHYITEYWDDANSLSSGTTIVVEGDAAPGSYDATLTSNHVLAQGTVTDESGNPLRNALVEARDTNNNTIQNCWTDSHGRWYFTGAMTGNVVFRAYDPSYEFMDEYYNDKADFASADKVPVVGNSTSPAIVDFKLAEMPPSITGRVTDELTGRPIKGVNVWLFGRYGPFAWVPIDIAFTDASGNYVFDNVDGWDCKVEFADPSGFYATEWWNNKPSISTALDVPGYPGADFTCDAKLLPKDGRVYGGDRFSNAVVIAEQQFPDWTGVHDIIIASGDDAAAADPLTAGSLCWAYDAPLLLTTKNGVPASLANAIKAIQAQNGNMPEGGRAAGRVESGVRIHVVGGPNSVPDRQLAYMESLVGAGNVERLPYGDRYETARQVALCVSKMRPGSPYAIVANGADPSKFFDALAASAIAARTGTPILLTRADVAPAATTKALTELAPSSVIVVGGTGSVSAAAYAQVGGRLRLAGANRYDTSVAVARYACRRGWLSVDGIGLASKVPDALTGGAAMGLGGGPLLVTASDSLPAPLYTFIDDNDYLISRVTIFGGPSSVTANVWSQVKAALKQ